MKSVDLVIVGTGVAGLYSALNIEEHLNVLLITKGSIRESNSYLAQGGISTAVNAEDIPLFIEDTLKAGRYFNRMDSVTILAEESMENIQRIVAYGVELDCNDSQLAFTKEGGHSISRIVHHRDFTGEAVVEGLLKNVIERPNISIQEHTELVDIIVENGICVGVILNENHGVYQVHAKAVVFAMGGIGGIFKSSTNQRIMTGDSLGIALTHGIEVVDTQYIQFHPTALYTDKTQDKRFLISEAVRGERAKLYNVHGESFVDPLLPRDVVTAAILKEMQVTGTPYVFLDITHLEEEYLSKRFPTIFEKCMEMGLNMAKDPIPVSPAQHYFMGGIESSIDGCTSMGQLYVVGESACTGVHGANRLASNSLLEGLVFAKRAAQHINTHIKNYSTTQFQYDCSHYDINHIRKERLHRVKEFFVTQGGHHAELFMD